jgi:hypothetical protein
MLTVVKTLLTVLCSQQAWALNSEVTPMSTTTDQIAEAFTAYIEENTKFTEKGNKAAGTRARKALLELAKLAKARRAEISEAKAEG